MKMMKMASSKDPIGRTEEETQEEMGSLVTRLPMSRKSKKLKRQEIISIMKGEVRALKINLRKKHLKYGVEIHPNYRECHSSSVPEVEQQKWRTEEVEEISTLEN